MHIWQIIFRATISISIWWMQTTRKFSILAFNYSFTVPNRKVHLFVGLCNESIYN